MCGRTRRVLASISIVYFEVFQGGDVEEGDFLGVELETVFDIYNVHAVNLPKRRSLLRSLWRMVWIDWLSPFFNMSAVLLAVFVFRGSS